MIRRIIKINEEKCNGCGICAAACHEGAIGMVDGRQSFCGTTTVTDSVTASPPVLRALLLLREAAAYDEAAVKAKAALQKKWGLPVRYTRPVIQKLLFPAAVPAHRAAQFPGLRRTRNRRPIEAMPKQRRTRTGRALCRFDKPVVPMAGTD